MTKRQTNFQRRDVNVIGSARCTDSRELPQRDVSTDWRQQLRWRGFAVSKNLSYRRCEVINTRAGDDDAVTAAMSFLCDTQESTALILAELDIEMLALNLQFSRLDDVVHFALRAPTLPHPAGGMEEKSSGSRKFLNRLYRPGLGTYFGVWALVNRLLGLRRMPLNLESRAPSYLNASGVETNALFLTSSWTRACPIQSIQALIDRRTRSAQPFRCRLEARRRPHDPYAAFRFGDFSLFTVRQLTLDHGPTHARGCGGMGDLRAHAFGHCAWAGWLGHRRPVVTLSLPAGHLADRISRKHIILVIADL